MNAKVLAIYSRFKWLFAIGFIVTVATILWLFVFNQGTGRVIPEALGELRLVEEIRGKEASDILNHLHGKGVSADENVVGNYVGSGGTATLYLSAYARSEDAREIEEKMVARIEKGTAEFHHYQLLNIRERPVSFCVGLGQIHYLFSVGDELYWLAADFSVASVAIDELLRIVDRRTKRLRAT